MIFDILTFADYSGAADLAAQRRHIFLATGKKNSNAVKITSGYTRRNLQKIITDILSGATKNNKRVLFGLDHNYAFPDGLIEAITGSDHLNWRGFMKMVNHDRGRFLGLGVNPRDWALQINLLLKRKYRLSAGPFWGPHFDPLKKPTGIYDKLPFSEKRLVEYSMPRMKSVFQLGGAGSVGMQSLWGMYHLSNIIAFCEENQIPLHCWPFDGFDLPEDKHVLIEIYPGYYNTGFKSDIDDARNTARFFLESQNAGNLENLFQIPEHQTVSEIIMREGWLPGVQ